MGLGLLLCVQSGGAGVQLAGGVAIHNNSDCCCVNLPDRSARNLVDTVQECVASCAAASGCHAAVLLEGRAAGNCHARVPPGKKCCLHKGHFDTMHHTGGQGTSTVIDLGTSSGPCPSHPPKPPPSPPSSALPGRPTYHYTRLAGEMNDPNGLQWTRLPDGTVEYHMVRPLSVSTLPRNSSRDADCCAVSAQFHQHGDPSCKGFDHTGSHAWGHGKRRRQRAPSLVLSTL
jgi:hypothetical protein